MRLRAAALERFAQLDDDSAIALYRRARAADPDYLAAQYEYVVLMIYRFRTPELRRELAAADRGTALDKCLAAAATSAPDDDRTVARLKALEAGNGPTPCTDLFLALLDPGHSDARLARAMQLNPSLIDVWSSRAGRLHEAGQWQAVDSVVRAGRAAADDRVNSIQLVVWLMDQHMARNDTAGAQAILRELDADIRRDGRPGPMAAYLAAQCTPHSFPGATPQTKAESCRQFFTLVRSRHARVVEWQTGRWVAKLQQESGELRLAMPLLTRLVRMADDERVAGMQLYSYTQRGRAYAKAGNLTLALRDLRHATAVGAQAGLAYYFAEAYHNLAHTYEGAGRFADAAAAADSFAALTAPLNHSSLRWLSRHDAGVIRWEAGWHAAATRDFEMMVRYVDEQDEDGHYFAGEYFERVGDLGRALQYYRIGASKGVDPRNLTALSRVYDALGVPDSAEAVARRHDADTRDWSLLEKPLLPELLSRRGRVAEAISLAEAWANRTLAGGNVQGAALAQLQVAKLRLLNREPESALVAAMSADSLSRLLSLTAEEIEAQTLAGRALADAGRTTQALSFLRRAARLAAAHPSIESLLSTNLALGVVLEPSNRADALAAYDRAALAVERMTAGLDDDVNRAGFKSRHLAPFDGALRILLRGTDADAALRWSVRRKAAALSLAGQPRMTAPPHFSVATVRGRLRSDEALIDFTVLDSTVAAIVVRRESATNVPLLIAPTRLAAWVTTLRRPLVSAPGGRIDLAHAPFDSFVAESLYRSLIAPLGAALSGIRTLAIAADGEMWYVPFAALVTGRRADVSGGPVRPTYLLEQYEMRLLPSALFLSREDAAPLPAGFHVDALTYSVAGGVAELEAIALALGKRRVTVREGAAATERAVLSARGDVLHVAAHAVWDDRDPLASHLRLASERRDDGLLHLSEVMARHGGPMLVVLTACEAVNGRLYAGEGLVGLARSFLLSGARQVVASQWPVDASAAQLTAVFYQELTRGRSPSAALRSAQLALLQTSSTSHPIHWAGFVLFDGGSGRKQ